MFFRSLADLQTRASAVSGFTPDTLDMDAGTVEVVLTTGAPVQRGGHVEVLAISRENVEFARRIPLLDSHRQTSIADIKGTVSNIRFEPGAVVATLHISDPAALAAVARGDVTGVSVGYRVKKWSERRDAKSGKLIRTAILFEIVECSLVAVPADIHATIRSSTMEEDEVIETGQQEVVSDPAADFHPRRSECPDSQRRVLRPPAGHLRERPDRPRGDRGGSSLCRVRRDAAP
jgi:hypothetical protein